MMNGGDPGSLHSAKRLGGLEEEPGLETTVDPLVFPNPSVILAPPLACSLGH